MASCFNPRKKSLSLFIGTAVLVNVATLYYIAVLQNSLASDKGTDASQRTQDNPGHQLKSGSDLGLTIIFREFEDFENDLKASVTSCLQSFPGQRVVIVSDKLPYPPLQIEDQGVDWVNFQPSPERPVWDSRPEHHIQTKYVLLMPDTVRPNHHVDVNYMTRHLEEQPSHIRMVAWTVGSHSDLNCLQLNVSLKHWTIQYSNSHSFCDAIDGEHALLMRTSDLFNMTYPFARPLSRAIFIQSAIRGWKVIVSKDTIFDKTRSLFQDAHQQWKYKTRTHARTKELYKTLGVKHVQQADGRHEWYGCDKQSTRCFGSLVNNMPDYLYQGRFTPPCCMRALRLTAKHVFDLLETQGVRYWLEGGSLLGAARNGDIIPWDYDIDIGIYKDDITKSEHLKQSLQSPYLDDKDFVWERAHEGDFFRVQYSETNHLHVDIFPFYSRNGTMTKDTWFPDHRQDTEFPERFLKPLERMTFAGTNARVPNNYRKFLEFKFGQGVIEHPRYPNAALVT